MLKAVFAHPFFMRGTACTAMFVLARASTPSFTSSPQATPTTPSYWFVFRIFVMHEPPGTTYTSYPFFLAKRSALFTKQSSEQ